MLCPGTIRLAPLLLPVATPSPQGLLTQRPSLWFLNGKLIFCFLPTLPVSQSLGLSAFRGYSIQRTRSDLLPPLVRRIQGLHPPTTDTGLLGLRWK